MQTTPECQELRADTRGDCDGPLLKVQFQTNLGSLETRHGETGFMCASHATQSTQSNEIVCLGRALEAVESRPVSDDGTIRPVNEAEQQIIDQVRKLGRGELLILQGVLDDLAAGRPVAHFEAGTRVLVDTWGDMEFVVQGTVPWYENGVVSRKTQIRSSSGNISGHVDPSELRRAR